MPIRLARIMVGQAGQGKERLGLARLGLAWQAWRGAAGRGKPRYGVLRFGRHGAACSGQAGHGQFWQAEKEGGLFGRPLHVGRSSFTP